MAHHQSSQSQLKSQPDQQEQPSPPPPPPSPKLAIEPPLECPQSDFDALLDDAAGLSSYEDASTELLDCARYGEVDACRAILDVWSVGKNTTNNSSSGSNLQVGAAEGKGEREQETSIVNAKDSSLTTPLHKACANGHASTVQLLLSRGALHVANDSGNTPLHWAAASGHADCVKLLLDHYDAIVAAHLREKNEEEQTTTSSSSSLLLSVVDVLQKNNFGRCALTEGFASGDTKTVEHLLNHDSAEEEKLIGGLVKKDVDDVEANSMIAGEDGNDTTNNGKAQKKDVGEKGIVHEFDFVKGDAEHEISDGRSPSVLIRELPIAHADNPFGQAPIEDTTGLGIWCASLVMSRWLATRSMVERMENKTILELGAGCGIPALSAAVYGTPKSVWITDLNPETVDNIRYNVELNGSSSSSEIIASSIDWCDESTYPPIKLDYVICSDCIYQKDIAPLLNKVVTGLLDPNNGVFLYVGPEGGRDGLPEFIAIMKSGGFECVKEEIAPDRFRDNPLKSEDEEDCFLHFHELASTVYILYEFRRR